MLLNSYAAVLWKLFSLEMITELRFCMTAQFVSGCVRITRKGSAAAALFVWSSRLLKDTKLQKCIFSCPGVHSHGLCHAEVSLGSDCQQGGENDNKISRLWRGHTDVLSCLFIVSGFLFLFLFLCHSTQIEADHRTHLDNKVLVRLFLQLRS